MINRIAPPQQGKVFAARYRLDNLLKDGVFVSVWKGRDVFHGMKGVVLKIESKPELLGFAHGPRLFVSSVCRN